MPYVRKARAGQANLGYEWPHDGAVIPVAEQDVPLLLAVPDHDFEVVDAPPAPAVEPESALVEEPAPEAEISEAPAPRRPRAAKKTAAAEPAAPVRE